MKIRNPPRPSNNGPIILYLPPGLPSNTLTHQKHDPLNTLAFSAHAIIVHINYRLSQKEPYPKPIHDVLASYDWILKHVLPTNHNDSPYRPQGPKLGICGELMGGSLAAMLALTECPVNKPGISATSLGNPIVDWSTPFDAPNFDPTNDFDEDIGFLRRDSFANLEHRYDPFASPLLFFRTPAFELPTPAYGFSSLTSKPEPPERDSPPTLTPQRRSHRKYPLADSGLRLPSTRIDVGQTNPLREQTMEFAHLMQRSVDLYERGNGGYRGASDEAQRRVKVVEREGKGLWGEGEMMEVGTWFGEVLRAEG
ncbi:MAG: hypothetical protein LQ343_003361 [Gyalolechia ehrenbergii]|nr:MAG: hypothetical protein LQ343_003361 [Gyalolechia ehrenbergii]